MRRVGERLALQVVRSVELAELAAEVFVEALRVRHVLGRHSEGLLAFLASREVEVPFTHLAGDVAGGLEAFGDRAREDVEEEFLGFGLRVADLAEEVLFRDFKR